MIVFTLFLNIIFSLCSLAYATPVGLQNCGNTCYQNSAIQAFFMYENFREELLKVDNKYLSDFLKNFKALLGDMQTLYNIDVGKRTRKFVACNKGGSLDTFQSLCFSGYGYQKGKQDDMRNFFSLISDQVENGWNNYEKTMPGKNNPYYNLRKTIRATMQDRIKKTKENSLQISLDSIKLVDLGAQGTINDYFANKDIKTEQEKLKKQGLPYTEIYPSMFYAPPPILFFGVSVKLMGGNKINLPDQLDLTKYIQYKSGDEFIYDLSFIGIHTGASFFSGHYYCYAKDPKDNKWYEINDSSVTDIDNNFNTIKNNIGSNIIFFAYKPKSIVSRAKKAENFGDLHDALKDLQRSLVKLHASLEKPS